MISRETEMISRESADQFTDSEQRLIFEIFNSVLDQTASKQAASKHIEQQAW